MKVLEVLESYSDFSIDQLATDKIDESSNLRLPRNLIIQEIFSALSSFAYIAEVLSPSKPPTYAFVKLLLDSPGYTLPIEGFQEKVLQTTDDYAIRAQNFDGISTKKNYRLYINLLKGAWESGIEIDKSEAQLLMTLRNELTIWQGEHLLLEHHPEIRQLWDIPGAYVSARNRLLLSGIVLTFENNYLIAEEVAIQIRRFWDLELEKSNYLRMLYNMKNEQLANILEKNGLYTSGTKEERCQRILNSFIAPSELLNAIFIDELREYCRENNIQISGKKSEVIRHIIMHYENNDDLENPKEIEKIPTIPTIQEKRDLNEVILIKLLQNFTNDQLYDILAQCYLKTSGTKDEKIKELVNSTWSDRSILNKLRKIELSEFCKRFGIPVSGIKNEIIDRIIEEAATRYGVTYNNAIEQDQESSIEALTIHSENEISVLNGVQTKEYENVPSFFSEIKNEYPELEKDEQIILALIKETKSLTEQDIERASKRHGLGWFLIKANMAEIIFKLRKNNKSPIKLKSIRSINIYEWIGDKLTEQVQSLSNLAKDVIDALRQGVVPEKNLDLLLIDETKTHQHLKDLLYEVKNNKSPFKFIRGPYGAGKTFLCSWLREYALKNEYVVSTVIIGPDQSLSDLPVFFSGVINGLRTLDKRDSSAIVDILESWLLNIHKKTAQIEGLSLKDLSSQQQLRTIVERRVESELEYLADLNPGFIPALRTFYRARSSNNQVLASTAVAWLSGSRSMSFHSLNEIGIKGYLEPNEVFPRIRTILEIIKGARYQGLVIFVDELEIIRRFPTTRQREQALEILRLLIDESGKNSFPGCLLIFTGTDSFFEDDRAGLKSYEALADRVIIPNAIEGMISMRQPVILLDGLSSEKILSMATKIRDLHGIAYNWNSAERLPFNVITDLVKEWTAFGEEQIKRKPRPVLRELIHILDLCEENPGISYYDLMQIPVRSDIHQLSNQMN